MKIHKRSCLECKFFIEYIYETMELQCNHPKFQNEFIPIVKTNCKKYSYHKPRIYDKTYKVRTKKKCIEIYSLNDESLNKIKILKREYRKDLIQHEKDLRFNLEKIINKKSLN